MLDECPLLLVGNCSENSAIRVKGQSYCSLPNAAPTCMNHYPFSFLNSGGQNQRIISLQVNILHTTSAEQQYRNDAKYVEARSSIVVKALCYNFLIFKYT
jgi:hypothetical protein